MKTLTANKHSLSNGTRTETRQRRNQGIQPPESTKETPSKMGRDGKRGKINAHTQKQEQHQKSPPFPWSHGASTEVRVKSRLKRVVTGTNTPPLFIVLPSLLVVFCQFFPLVTVGTDESALIDWRSLISWKNKLDVSSSSARIHVSRVSLGARSWQNNSALSATCQLKRTT